MLCKQISYQLYVMPGHFWVDYEERQPYVWIEGYEWIENSENAILRWENSRWHFQGMGWLRVLPAMMGIQAQLYWRIVPWVGKAVLLVAIIAAVGLARFLRRRGAESV